VSALDTSLTLMVVALAMAILVNSWVSGT
jgi:hypothetical protein